MDCSKILISQYLAALTMLGQTVSRCPDPIWDSADDKIPFWRVAYHALFYTHLYLQDSEQSFIPWNRHRKEYQFIGPVPRPPYAPPQIGIAYDRNDLLDYLTFCRQQVTERIPQVNLEAPSGFDWLPFTKLELQLYNLRHLQQHTGELMERLGSRAGLEIDWVVMEAGNEAG